VLGEAKMRRLRVVATPTEKGTPDVRYDRKLDRDRGDPAVHRAGQLLFCPGDRGAGG
jgi:hypothetical protein